MSDIVAENNFVDISGISLFVQKLIPEGYSESKERPVVIFLHEGLGSIGQWRDFPEKFLTRCRLPVLLYDRMGYGKSSPRKEKRGLDYIHREEELLSLLIRNFIKQN